MQKIGRFWNSGEAKFYKYYSVGHLGKPHSFNKVEDQVKLIKVPVMYLISRQHSRMYRRKNTVTF